MIHKLPTLNNGQTLPLAEVPLLAPEPFRAAVQLAVSTGHWIAALFGYAQGNELRQLAVLADPDSSKLRVLSAPLPDRYPALTPACVQAHWFERELADQWGVVPEGHPWLKPIRFHPSYRPGHDAWDRPAGQLPIPADTNFYTLQGSEAHEVAVGPIHAGVIEPGHFRFQCHGEIVYHLEISLGFQHRGVEKALRGGPTRRTPHLIETLSGDTSIGHVTAYSQIVEGLAGCEAPLRAQALRGLALELERLANHTGDLGALANDIGFLPTASYCGRLRGNYLNATAALCGNRFGRGLVRPGGVEFGLDQVEAAQLHDRLQTALKETASAARLLWETPSVQARFEDTGVVSRQAAQDLGLVGVAAHASGLDWDVRHNFPAGISRFALIPVSSSFSGDVFARAYVRGMEIQRSGDFLLRQLKSLPQGKEIVPIGPLRPETLVVSLVEGWRGAICHVALTDALGRFAHYKVVDPSFHNWFGLALALRGQEISDFPLCNKSFNLSYCGHDL